ncbi:MAG: metallophosphoesterase [Halieaceae bacterium]|nr:metallophosphoesterase [Halieaceae bacterium]
MAQQFAQVSDPHLSDLGGVRLSQLLSKRLLSYLSWRRKRRFEHRREVLSALADDLATLELSQLLVTGDLTHTGLPEEFRQAQAWLESLGAADTVAVIPGNHDALVRDDPGQTFALWQDYMASDPDREAGFPSLRIRGELAFIGLSSAVPTPPLMASGEVSAAQLSELGALLDATRGKFRVVYVHHSPVPGVEKWRKALRNASAVADTLATHGAELVLHGHGHRARLDHLPGADGEVPVFAVPSASARGLYGADVAAYNRYRVERQEGGWRLTVEQRRLDDAGEQFEVAGAQVLTLPRP